MKKTVLVVGGAGYIGSHMVLALEDASLRPVVFDNLSRGHADAVSGAPLVVGDLRSAADLDACFAAHRVDVVMHFAAPAYVGESVTAPDLYYQNNVVGALNLLSAMRRHGQRRLVFSSSCATYGEPERVPIDEAHPQRPINPYGRTKLVVEQALADYARADPLESVLEVIEACRKVTGQPIEYRSMPRRPGDPASLIGDGGKALQVLRWRPQHAELKAIIRSAWSWMETSTVVPHAA